MNFVIETAWVMFAHGLLYLVCGLAIALGIVLGASRCVRVRLRLPLMLGAILVLWIALFLAADSGYRTWQQLPDPPSEAFSDTGPFLLLFLGWLPGAVIAFIFQLLCGRPVPWPGMGAGLRSGDGGH